MAEATSDDDFGHITDPTKQTAKGGNEAAAERIVDLESETALLEESNIKTWTAFNRDELIVMSRGFTRLYKSNTGSLENLVTLIYHEKQQPGSMLCAQHALNNLLQGNYFTAPDLSAIASDLDALEHSYDGAHTGSTNMDDTGFFSVQVLENALTVWGLNLARWRGENMRPYQEYPHAQLAFILNLRSHWYTLRRFGHAESNMNDDIGGGHWFNLDSLVPEPEWVGKLHLGMLLQEAEAQGYSVFAVTQIDPSAPLSLCRTDADAVASTLPEPTSANPHANRPSTSSVPDHPDQIEGLEDVDYDLQAALQASLMGGHFGATETVPHSPPRLVRSFAPLPADDSEYFAQSSSHRPTGAHLSSNIGRHDEMEDEEDVQRGLLTGEQVNIDPVAASMERSRLMLQRMRAHQEFAHRELFGEGSLNDVDAAALEARRAQRQREEQEEAEELRRAIAESEALAQTEGHAHMDVNRPQSESLQSLHSQRVHGGGDRMYDDDDEDFQAAIRASLKEIPQGFTFPELPSQPTPSRSISTVQSSDVAVSPMEDQDADVESVLSTEAEDHPSSNASAEDVSVDELRKRRLARFGM
ncbi:hypothetical protein H0H87_004105 [Tephrocybe sp. NHM501043]|nr:hypothetical protein H0H87_004105 [Tephrocybe sp. NHM501043]